MLGECTKNMSYTLGSWCPTSDGTIGELACIRIRINLLILTSNCRVGISPVLASGFSERALRAERLLGRLPANQRKQRSTDQQAAGTYHGRLVCLSGDVDGVGSSVLQVIRVSSAIPENYTFCLTITIIFPRSQNGIFKYRLLPQAQRVVTRRSIRSSTRIMLVLKCLSVLALAAFAAANTADNDVPELVIDKTHVPADCTVTSKKGDKIQVHYVGGISLFPVWLSVAERLITL